MTTPSHTTNSPVPVAPAAAAGTTAPTNRARTAGRATLMVIGFVLLSRVLGVLRSMAVAHVFGQNATTDIYNRAFAVPDMLYLLVAGGALSSTFIPVFTEYVEKKREDEAWRTFGLVVTLVAVAAAVLICIAEALAYPLARFAAPEFSDTAVLQMVPLTRVLLPAQWFFFVGGLFMATLQTRNRWLIPSLGPVIYNAGIIVGALLFGRQYGPIALTIGALIGAAIGNFALPVWDLLRSGARFSFGVDLKHPGVLHFGKLLLPAMLGLGLSQLGFLMTGFFLGEGGEFTALKNGNELTQAPIGIFAQASAMVLFPTLAALAAQQDWVAYRQELHYGIRRIFFLTVPASLLMAALAEPIIALLYQGDKFGIPEINNAALALRMYSLGTFAWSLQAVLGRGFYALHDTKTPLNITKFMIVLMVAQFFLYDRMLHLNFSWLAIAMSLVGTINAIWLFFALSRRVGGLNARGIFSSAWRITLASALSSGAALLLMRLLGDALGTGRLAALITLALAGGVTLVLYIGLSWALRIPELSGVRALFRRPRGGNTNPNGTPPPVLPNP